MPAGAALERRVFRHAGAEQLKLGVGQNDFPLGHEFVFWTAFACVAVDKLLLDHLLSIFPENVTR